MQVIILVEQLCTLLVLEDTVQLPSHRLQRLVSMSQIIAGLLLSITQSVIPDIVDVDFERSKCKCNG